MTIIFLNKGGGLHKFVTALLNFIKNKIPKSFNNKEFKQAFKELKAEMEEIAKDYWSRNYRII